jgi:hypothetical protein
MSKKSPPTDAELLANTYKEHERCINAMQDLVQKKIVPIDPVHVIGHLCTVDKAIEWYINKLEMERDALLYKVTAITAIVS